MEGCAVRGFGVLVLLAGLIALLASMVMDVSVPSGLGRVNNIGLMAERQNFIIISGLFALGGLLMILLGGKKNEGAPVAEGATSIDTRPCPFCAEPIKAAAIKCKHCGADVPKGVASDMRAQGYGWTLRIDCDAPESLVRASQAFEELGLTCIEPDGLTAICGFFLDKEHGMLAKRDLASRHRLEGYLYYQPAR